MNVSEKGEQFSVITFLYVSDTAKVSIYIFSQLKKLIEDEI